MKKKILLLDDEPDLTFMSKKGLGAGLSVDEFDNSIQRIKETVYKRLYLYELMSPSSPFPHPLQYISD